MPAAWMIRAGERGWLADEFAAGYVAIGWNELGSLEAAADIESVRELYLAEYPDSKPGERGNAVGMINKFRNVIAVGDDVVTYDPQRREYLIGKIASDYMHRPGVVSEMNHVREVKWAGRRSRDALSAAARNSLGSTLTIFSINEDVWAELSSAGPAKPVLADVSAEEDERTELGLLREETVSRAHEFIKDRILHLSAHDMEKLAAAILRALGYRARVTPVGPDRGVDVLASPDGLGLEEPRIKAEVKHRPSTAMGSHEIRSFLGGLRDRDRGLYISTGGFTKEAKYEAERSSVPVTLVDLDDLADLVVAHYECFDTEGRALVPLVKVYWPVE